MILKSRSVAINLLTPESASFEGGTDGGWTTPVNCSFAASTDQAYHGSRSGKMTVTANGATLARNEVTATTAAGSQYTASARFKGVVGRQYRLRAVNNGGVFADGTLVTADGTWQTATVTITYGGASTNRYIYLAAYTDALAGEVSYWDAIQLEAGAAANPLALDVTVSNLPYQTAVRLFDTSGNTIGSAVESGGTATVTPTTSIAWIGLYYDSTYTVLLDRYPEGGNGSGSYAIYGGDAYWYEPRKVTYVKFME
jgi:hypothetical protein